MSEPVRDLDAALASVADRWDDARTERTLEGLHRKRGRQRTRKLTAAGAGVVVLGLIAVEFGALQAPPSSGSAALQPSAAGPRASDARALRPADAHATPSSAMQPTPAGDALHLQLADGSEVWLHDSSAQVRVDEVTPAQVALELRSGRARFDVLHREERRFRVHSGAVTIEVLGTSFELERETTRTRVLVLRGRVGVAWPGGRTELAAGEAGWFPRLVPATAASDYAPQLAAAEPGAKAAQRKARNVPSAKTGHESVEKTWREPAEQGDFAHAYQLLSDSPRPVADDVEELLLAADTARLSGHPEAALPFLRRVIERHGDDSRAPLAAFTLGGVLMQQLGQPREAEVAYARARALSLNASLAEDALARQVEAAHRADDATRARQLAREYLDQYPNGRRVHAVQRFGGLPH